MKPLGMPSKNKECLDCFGVETFYCSCFSAMLGNANG